MSSAPSKKTGWLNDNYEKISIFIVLVLLLASALYLVLMLGRERQNLNIDRSGGRPGQEAKAELLDAEPLNALMASMDQPVQIQGRDQHLTVSERRVVCVNPECMRPIPYISTNCWFCKTDQPLPDEIDTDMDGISDEIEKKWGMDHLNPNDVDIDSDGDGFTNREEIEWGSDPRDPDDYPDITAKLRVVQVVQKPFRFLFTGVQQLADGARYQLNLKKGGRTWFLRLGENAEGYTISKYDEDITVDPKSGKRVDKSRLTLEKSGKKIVLTKGEPQPSNQREVVFVLITDESRYRVPLDGDLKIGNDVFKLEGIEGTSALIRGREDGELKRIPQITREELMEIREKRKPGPMGQAMDMEMFELPAFERYPGQSTRGRR